MAARADDGARPPPPASFLTRSRVAGETGVGCEGLVQAAHADCSAATGPALVDAAPGAAERGLSRPTFSGFYLPIFFNSGQLKSQTLAVDMGTPLPLLSHARLFTAAVRRGFDLCRMLRSKVTKVVPCISFVFKHRGLYIYSVGYCLVSNSFFPQVAANSPDTVSGRSHSFPTSSAIPVPQLTWVFPNTSSDPGRRAGFSGSGSPTIFGKRVLEP